MPLPKVHRSTKKVVNPVDSISQIVVYHSETEKTPMNFQVADVVEPVIQSSVDPEFLPDQDGECITSTPITDRDCPDKKPMATEVVSKNRKDLTLDFNQSVSTPRRTRLESTSYTSNKSKQSWLLRLFESKLFDMSLAITYLFNSKEQGVQVYIGECFLRQVRAVHKCLLSYFGMVYPLSFPTHRYPPSVF